MLSLLLFFQFAKPSLSHIMPNFLTPICLQNHLGEKKAVQPLSLSALCISKRGHWHFDPLCLCLFAILPEANCQCCKLLPINIQSSTLMFIFHCLDSKQSRSSTTMLMSFCSSLPTYPLSALPFSAYVKLTSLRIK